MSKRHEIDKRGHSPASPATIYAMLLDRPTWPTWSPLSSFTPESDGAGGPAGVGAIGTFTTGRTKSREEIVELVVDRRLSYRLLSGLPLRDYRADIDLTPTATGTDIRWHSTFGARWGTGWAYRFGLGRFIGRMVAGLVEESARRAAAPQPDAAR